MKKKDALKFCLGKVIAKDAVGTLFPKNALK